MLVDESANWSDVTSKCGEASSASSNHHCFGEIDLLALRCEFWHREISCEYSQAHVQSPELMGLRCSLRQQCLRLKRSINKILCARLWSWSGARSFGASRLTLLHPANSMTVPVKSSRSENCLSWWIAMLKHVVLASKIAWFGRQMYSAFLMAHPRRKSSARPRCRSDRPSSDAM